MDRPIDNNEGSVCGVCNDQTERVIATPHKFEPSHDTPTEDEEDNDAPTCRICYDASDGSDQGYLFRPCLCKGSCGWIHVGCLEQWRALSVNPKSQFRCEQCHYEYKFGFEQNAKFRFTALITSRWFTEIATIISLLTIIMIVGTCAEMGFGISFNWTGIVADDDELAEEMTVWLGESNAWLNRFLLGTGHVGFFSTGASLIAWTFSYGFMMIDLPMRLLLRFHSDRGSGNSGNIAKVIYIVIGIGIAFYGLHQMIRAWTAFSTRKLASYVLDVHGRKPGAQKKKYN
eukprot:m.262715 g.262715  ORF g.262715 m.262715 type:complete len:287 (-) comp46764_c0_seq1:78-938(-)